MRKKVQVFIDRDCAFVGCVALCAVVLKISRNFFQQAVSFKIVATDGDGRGK
jgi:hypothetical protein